jgi:hypothetical protein
MGGEPTSPDTSAGEWPLKGEDDHERQHAHLDELDETLRVLEEEPARLHQELGVEAAPTLASEHAQEVCCHINSDIHGMLIAKWAS